MKLTPTEFALLDDVLARLIDAKIAGAPVTDEHLVLIIRLQDHFHEHSVGQRWEDGQDVAYCTVCGATWGGTTRRNHGLPRILTTDREDGIDWPVWVCACGCGEWGTVW